MCVVTVALANGLKQAQEVFNLLLASNEARMSVRAVAIEALSILLERYPQELLQSLLISFQRFVDKHILNKNTVDANSRDNAYCVNSKTSSIGGEAVLRPELGKENTEVLMLLNALKLCMYKGSRVVISPDVGERVLRLKL